MTGAVVTPAASNCIFSSTDGLVAAPPLCQFQHLRWEVATFASNGSSIAADSSNKRRKKAALSPTVAMVAVEAEVCSSKPRHWSQQSHQLVVAPESLAALVPANMVTGSGKMRCQFQQTWLAVATSCEPCRSSSFWLATSHDATPQWRTGTGARITTMAHRGRRDSECMRPWR